MVTDKMLQQAASEVELAMLSLLSTQNIEPHHFSARFEKKMRKLLRQAKHPMVDKISRSAVAILLVVFILFGSIMAMSPEVRAEVIGWIKGVFFEFSQYSSAGELESPEYEYHFIVAPEGYTELQVINSQDGKTFLYVNDTGSILQFTYAYGGQADNLFLKTETYSQEKATVGGASADIYIASNDIETNAILWRDPKTETLLCIQAKVEKSILVALAESVMKTEK